MTEQTANKAAGQVQEGAQQWLGMLQTLAEQIQKQQQTFQQQAEQQQQAFQQMVQESMNTFMQMFNIPLSYAQEGLQTARRATAEVPRRGLRRDERLRGCTAVGQPLYRRIAAGSRLREAQ